MQATELLTVAHRVIDDIQVLSHQEGSPSVKLNIYLLFVQDCIALADIKARDELISALEGEKGGLPNE